jgi:hypothetical protein
MMAIDHQILPNFLILGSDASRARCSLASTLNRQLWDGSLMADSITSNRVVVLIQRHFREMESAGRNRRTTASKAADNA